MLGKIMYNYLTSSWGIILITIWVWTSECKLIKTLNLPRDLISFESCINEGLILTWSTASKILHISVGFTDP